MAARAFNAVGIMALIGAWHGAGWKYVLWGLGHGFGLAVSIGWRSLRKGSSRAGLGGKLAGAVAVTAFVSALGPLFAAADVPAAWRVMRGLAGVNGFSMPGWAHGFLGDACGGMCVFDGFFSEFGGDAPMPLMGARLLLLSVIMFLMPNTQEIAGEALETPKPGSAFWQWKKTAWWGMLTGLTATAGLLGLAGGSSSFVYFQF